MPTYSNHRDTARAWAGEKANSGKSGSRGSFSFDGEYLFSYSTAIARLTDARTSEGKRIALVTERRYSATTSTKHIPPAIAALLGNDFAIFRVNNMFLSESAHRENMEQLIDRSISLHGKAARALKRNRDARLADARDADDLVIQYKDAFELGPLANFLPTGLQAGGGGDDVTTGPATTTPPVVEDATDEQFVDAAKAQYTRAGEVEIDEGALVSRGNDDGAYVQAWVWVPFAEARAAREADL